MVAILLSAAVTCVAALFLGQAALRLAGAREWSWLAPPVGISVAMLVAAPANHVPGRCATMAVLLGALTIAAIVWCGRSRAHRPPLRELVSVLPVVLLVLVPFLAAGRAGILGVSLSNDMSPHMSIVEGYLSQLVWDLTPPPSDYPLGPHAMVAVISEGLGMRVDRAFAGWTMALPLLSGWTALAMVRRASWFGRMVTATVVGLPFLVAAYYGQGSFKEVLQACLVLAAVLLLAGWGPALGRGRWVPLGLVAGGMVSVYSVAGLTWLLLFCGIWVVVTAAARVAGSGTAGLVRAAVRELPAIGIGVGVFVLSILPQLPRLLRFFDRGGDGGIAKDDIGNLVGPLPGWEVFGVWNNPDFRLPAEPAFTGGMWTALVVILALAGAVWAFRTGRWMLPLAAGGALVLWKVSADSQSPYVAAKALVIASPLVLALAVLPLVDRDRTRPSGWFLLAPLLALVLVARVADSDLGALRHSPVGPEAHASELRSLRPVIDGEPTLFLGNDDFIEWELAGVPVGAPINHAGEYLPIRPEKSWEYGDPLDIDAVDSDVLNQYEWVITTRGGAGSSVPPQLRRARATDSFVLWRRVAPVPPREVLAEGDEPGRVLDCGSEEGAAALAGGGVAAVRRRPVVVPGATLAEGTAGLLAIALPAGAWDLQADYTSSYPVDVSAPGLRTVLPANLDRPGSLWPVGRIESDGGEVVLTFEVGDALLAAAPAGASLVSLVATPVAPVRVVPIRRACGEYVDWYRNAAPAQ
jgi:hypothetical protein